MNKKSTLGILLLVLSTFTLFGQRFARLTDYVNPFIGTGGHGHTYPGASYPFGMVQVSPDTRLSGWDGCSAYHASDDTIFGFSHTHLSGTGCSDYGDILLMPVAGKVTLSNYGYASPIDSSSEKATPGYYRVRLTKGDIMAELTATKRTGFHRYTFPATTLPGMVLDLNHRDNVIESDLHLVNDREVEGYRFSTAWAREQRVYFVIRFSRPIQETLIECDGNINQRDEEIRGKDIKALFRFQPFRHTGELLVKVGISAVSIEGARMNLDKEDPGWDFDNVLEECRVAWTKELEKITVNGGSLDNRMVFYTALYHALLSPNLYMDIDGKYLGRDLHVHQADSFDYYTVFSLWDTYRALHPLLTIIDRKRTNDFIRTFLRQYEEGGLLPVWELSANETNCMIGYHSVPVIADAFIKGIGDYDAEEALEAMKTSANKDQFGLRYYNMYGFIPGDKESESVSKTLEYAYDDWCIARMAEALGKPDDYREYIRRAQYYKNLFDPSSGFMRAKMNNQWFTPFDPYEVNFNYTEANAWQYSFYVPQDINGLIGLMGGKEKFAQRLDDLFSADMATTGRDQADITGLIGQYAQGNEPSHHMAYLYDFAGQPWKTQRVVHNIMSHFFTNQRDGLCGNEDCGQMSAWYVFSALGFYPVTPGSGVYAIGTPRFPFAKIELENGKTFTISANNISDSNFYIQSCTLDGQNLEAPLLGHEEIMKGGSLVFEMGNTPNYDWGKMPDIHLIPQDDLIEPVPFVASGEATFFDSTVIVLSSPDPDAKIYYQTDSTWHLFTVPITLTESSTLSAYALRVDGTKSHVIESVFQKIPRYRKVKLNTGYAPQYSAGGEVALVDFVKGSENFRTGLWQGYEGADLDAVVDLGELQEVHKISVGFLQDAGSWILFPVEVIFSTSDDGEHFTPAGVSIHEISQKDFTPRTLEQWITLDPPVQARYVKVVAKNQGICPDWHPGAGNKCWIFVDEISID